MSLTQEQIATFAAHLEANENQTIIDALASGNNNAIVAWYNQTAEPAVWVFRHSVDVDEVRRSLDWDEVLDGTDGLTVRQQWGFNTLMHNGTYDPSEENNRQALIRIFPASMSDTRAAMLADATRNATYAESIFIQAATGPGGGNGSAQGQSAIAVFEGDISLQDVRDAVAIINA